ncbi:fibronectin type III domain-containing protein [Pseudomonas sp. GL-RE-26]|uniref:fibronectin type III domain-containing protein n=1 Tax=Pseudomonas sp. GL-RE-26 TaxID=2832390 RepID=UPI001CBE04B5|nr:fibronectin type III domain-containing protein [Pseudomonas sp. GL-RE-26]
MVDREHPSALPQLTYVALPVTIAATPQSESSISVIWGYMAGGGHTGTRLLWETEGGMVGGFDVPISSLRYVLTGLKPDTRYTIKAFGLKGSEVSPGSKDAQATTKPASSLPASPTNLATAPTKDTISLTWSGPANASIYKLSYGRAPSGPVIRNETTMSMAYTFNGLSAGTLYYFEVRSSNNVGDSAPARITQQTLQVPSMPGGLRATASISAMAVEWSASIGAVDYVIRFGVEPGGPVTTLTTQLLRHPLENLIKNTLYFIEVSARNHNGESAPARTTQKTLDGPPLPPKPGSLHVVTTHDAVSIVWAPPQSAGYLVSIGIETAQREVFATEATPYMNHRFQGLRPDTRYFIEVRATNASGESEPSLASASTPTFQAPQDLSVDGLTDDSARLSWRANADYTTQTQYEIYLGNQLLMTQTESTCRITGLIEQSGYEAKVRAKGIGKYGLGDYFSGFVSKRFNTPAYDGVRICAPGNLSCTRNTATTVLLSWDDSYERCDLCPNAVGYEVSGAGIATINVARPPCEISGLSTDRQYLFSVRARAGGNNVSSPADCLIGACPDTPSSLQVTGITGTGATLAWSIPAGNVAVADYLVACDGWFVGATREMEYTFSLLEPGKTYRVEVRARSGAGGLSAPVTATFTTGDTSNSPRNLHVTENESHRVSIVWDPPLGPSPIGYRVSVLWTPTDVIQPEHTLFNLIPGLPLNIAVCSRFAADVVSDWVYVQVLPKP